MKRFDRRALFASGAAAAILAAAGASMAQTPRRGGLLRIAVPRADGLLESAAKGAVFDKLTEIGPDGILRAELATSWRSDDEGRFWEFELRSGVSFHSGKVLTLDDVILSLEALETSLLAGALFASSEQGGLSIFLPDPNPNLPFSLAQQDSWVTKAGAGTGALGTWDGTGMYRIEGAEADRRLKAVRSQFHYKDGDAGWVDALEVIVIPDPSVRSEALRDGYVDVATLPDATGLIGRNGLIFFPSPDQVALAVSTGVGIPSKISKHRVLDDERIAERWWML